MLHKISNRIARMETRVAALLAGVVTLLVLLNIASRSLGHAIYWVDELAIYCMVWMAFLTSAVLLKRREGVSVTLLTDSCTPAVRRALALFSDLVILVFALVLLWLCLRWYDPVALARSGFDLQAFQAQTFNFIYAENTSTLGLKKFWIWLALPFFAVSLSLHALSNLLECLSARPALAGETA
ncbi:TRAP transporter small permease subunit [Marinobacterium rhizophilum]|uniref:TRAP transporter small permease protein n=2 Tax=Marinobacterium rhizophilum TaxID=420402 RepID=A0ABY5HT70_9GAMM|nr:TRAP transporter small permease subunit [Marinobacterium rhizophilum]